MVLEDGMLISAGCSADDLIPEESPEVQLALKRLSPKEAYDRVFRMRRAFQVFSTHRETGGRVKGTEMADTGNSARCHINCCPSRSGPSRTR